MKTIGGYRFFRGEETKQIDGITGAKAHDRAWYFEPIDYEGDVLFSSPFDTLTLAVVGCDEYRKGGRPPESPTGEARNRVLKVRLSESELRDLKDLVYFANSENTIPKSERINASEYVRRKVLAPEPGWYRTEDGGIFLVPGTAAIWCVNAEDHPSTVEYLPEDAELFVDHPDIADEYPGDPIEVPEYVWY